MVTSFFILLVISCALSFSVDAVSMRSLVHRKYKWELNALVNGDLSRPLSFELVHLNDSEVDALLDNFEADPRAVYTNRYLSMYVIDRNIRDFDSDSRSRAIIRACMLANDSEVFLSKALIAAARFNVPSVVNLIVSRYGKVNFENEYFFGFSPGFEMELIKSGNFAILKNLIMKGLCSITPLMLAIETCSRCPLTKVDQGIDFLRFLIVERKEFGIDDIIYEDLTSQNRPQLLYSVLTSHQGVQESQNPETLLKLHEYKQKMVSFLLSLGADPDELDSYGKSARIYAREQGISLTLNV